MSLLAQNLRIGLEQNGEIQYLTDIQFYKVHEEEKVSYQLSPEGQVLTNDGATVTLKRLKVAEPEKHFIALPVDTVTEL